MLGLKTSWPFSRFFAKVNVCKMQCLLCAFSLLLVLLCVFPKSNNCALAYSPVHCTPSFYRFSLLRENTSTFWQVHGLWIEQCDECHLCGCPTDCLAPCAFNASKLTPLRVVLQRFWFPGVDLRKNTLIAHEWCKHGT